MNCQDAYEWGQYTGALYMFAFLVIAAGIVLAIILFIHKAGGGPNE